jgi:hypothetical protein
VSIRRAIAALAAGNAARAVLADPALSGSADEGADVLYRAVLVSVDPAIANSLTGYASQGSAVAMALGGEQGSLSSEDAFGSDLGLDWIIGFVGQLDGLKFFIELAGEIPDGAAIFLNDLLIGRWSDSYVDATYAATYGGRLFSRNGGDLIEIAAGEEYTLELRASDGGVERPAPPTINSVSKVDTNLVYIDIELSPGATSAVIQMRAAGGGADDPWTKTALTLTDSTHLQISSAEPFAAGDYEYRARCATNETVGDWTALATFTYEA